MEEGVPPVGGEADTPTANAWGSDLINAAAAGVAAPVMKVLVSDPRIGSESRNKMGRKKSTVRVASWRCARLPPNGLPDFCRVPQIMFKVTVGSDLPKYQSAKDGGQVYRYVNCLACPRLPAALAFAPPAAVTFMAFALRLTPLRRPAATRSSAGCTRSWARNIRACSVHRCRRR